jgi:uncharacterized protein (UPF0332 family)
MRFSNTREVLKALEKAADAIQNAQYNLQGGFISATANRAYYACYYCMTALLYTRNIYAKTHQGTRTKFSEHFIKTEIFAKETSDTIAMLFDYRQQADYDLDTDITSEEASNIITKATGFYNLCHEYLHDFLLE